MSTEIEYYRGDSYPKEFTITDQATGNPVNLTGFVLTMTVNSDSDPTDNTNEVFTVTGVVTDAAEGKVTFTPTAENNSISAVTYYYDIQMVGGGITRTVIKDKYIITQDINKS